MTPVTFTLLVLGVSVAAGVLGSLVGLGGGIILVPALTLLFGVDIRYAIGASIIAVIATSCGAGSAYVRQHLANIRVAMFLESATTLGALAGAFLAGVIGGRWLHLIFAGAMAYTAVAMWRHDEAKGLGGGGGNRLSEALRLHGSYFDQRSGEHVSYRVRRAPMGFALSGIAGVLSGLLGIGGGFIKVPAMALGMGMPIKVASATSNFMIGVTAAASAGVYFMRGDVNPTVAVPTALGVLGGSLLGTRIMGRLESSALKITLALVLIAVAIQMARKGIVS